MGACDDQCNQDRVCHKDGTSSEAKKTEPLGCPRNLGSMAYNLLIYKSGQIIATSHDLTPKGSWVMGIPLFQGNPGWWNIIIWPDKWGILGLLTHLLTIYYNFQRDIPGFCSAPWSLRVWNLLKIQVGSSTFLSKLSGSHRSMLENFWGKIHDGKNNFEMWELRWHKLFGAALSSVFLQPKKMV